MIGSLLLLAACAQAPDASEVPFLQGVRFYQSGNHHAARDAFDECLRLRPERTDCMTNLASVLIDLGEDEAQAETLYRNVLNMEPAHSDAAFNLALMLQDRKVEDALREAATLYLEVTAADPRRWDAWANLATCLAELKDSPIQACRAYQKAIVELERSHAATAAAADVGAAPEPPAEEKAHLAQLYYGFGMQLSLLSAAQCTAFANDPTSLLVGVDASGSSSDSVLVCSENAQNALRSALELNPDHVQAEHMLAAMLADSGEQVSKASAAFVTSLFDDFSDSFDEKLAALGYQVPKLVGEAVAAHVRAVRRGVLFASALDAGCGTGLAGPHLRPLVTGTLAGVDLSQKMLERAALLRREDGVDGPVYDMLRARDLETLHTADVLPPRDVAQGRGVELVTAADVLVYFGDLHELLLTFSHVSAASSVLVFSCERADDNEAPAGWKLRSTGRFAHTKEYVVDEAHKTGGYKLVAYEQMVPRLENGMPVQGHLFVFMR